MTNQQQVGEWHRRTFSDCEPARLRKKLYEEWSEANYELRVAGYRNGARLRDEIADVAIVLMAIADRCGFDLQQAIDDKFARVTQKYDGWVDDYYTQPD